MTHTSIRSQAGFTLIELSIVLVIIGLIVGGVLVGQDLIKGAEIRAAVSQIEKYDAAANTFRGKYNGFPGDLLSPGNFGFSTTFTSGWPNGNGRIDAAAEDGTSFDNEAAAFFRQLSVANLIADSITITDFTTGNVDTITAVAPVSKVAGGTYILVRTYSGLNYYTLARAATVTDGVAAFSNGGELRVIDAFQIDTKLDDGLASTGRVRAVTDFATADTRTDCHTSGTYDTAASPTQTTCSLQVRTSF